MDALGTRLGLLPHHGGWTFACASHGLAASFGTLAASRLLLGMGEGGVFGRHKSGCRVVPPAANAPRPWASLMPAPPPAAFSPPPPSPYSRVRQLAVGLLSGRGSGLCFGRSGGSFPTFPRARHPRLSARRRGRQEVIVAPAQQAEEKISWLDLFAYKEVWGLVIAKFMTDAVWYFILFWLPPFLQNGTRIQHQGSRLFRLDSVCRRRIGLPCGWLFFERLVKRGLSLNFARKIAMGVSVSVMPCLFFATIVPTAWVIVVLALAISANSPSTGHRSCLSLFPRRVDGAVAGLFGFGALWAALRSTNGRQMLDHKLGDGPIFAIART